MSGYGFGRGSGRLGEVSGDTLTGGFSVGQSGVSTRGGAVPVRRGIAQSGGAASRYGFGGRTSGRTGGVAVPDRGKSPGGKGIAGRMEPGRDVNNGVTAKKPTEGGSKSKPYGFASLLVFPALETTEDVIRAKNLEWPQDGYSDGGSDGTDQPLDAAFPDFSMGDVDSITAMLERVSDPEPEEGRESHPAPLVFLVLGVFMPLVGLIGELAIRKRVPSNKKGLVKAGIIVSVVSMLLWVLGGVGLVASGIVPMPGTQSYPMVANAEQGEGQGQLESALGSSDVV